MHDVDNPNGTHVNTDPNANGIGQIPNTSIPNVPTNPGVGNNQPAPNAPEESQAGTTFEELAEKKGFKSPDDLANSYVHLERLKSTEPARSQIDSTPPNVRPEPTQPTRNNESTADQEARLRRVETRFELEDLQRQYPDVAEFAQDILEKVKQAPGMSLEDAYWAAKGRRTEQDARQEGVDQGRAEGVQVAEAKIRAGSAMPGARHESGPPIGERIQQAKSLDDLQAIENMLPHS